MLLYNSTVSGNCYFGEDSAYLPEDRFELEPYPAIRAWLDRVAAQPGHVTINANESAPQAK
jgi:glutathione S-transferase